MRHALVVAQQVDGLLALDLLEHLGLLFDIALEQVLLVICSMSACIPHCIVGGMCGLQ